jgi:tRNA A37 threonylcarbamoyladenosine biosynthesis protein TsaE
LLVEWGDPVAGLLAEDRLRVELVGRDPTGADETRRITVGSTGPSWAERADAITAALERWSV